MRVHLHISALTILLLLTTVSAAQDMKALKAGVVRIKNNSSGEVGAGFIVKIDKGIVYIVTASHVVKGAGNPQLFFFDRQLEPLTGEQINRDDDNPRGLALLVFKSVDPSKLSGLTSLRLANSSEINGGEAVKIIGFPASSSFWDVSAGIISRLEGNNLIFAAPIRGGNSGGPIILSDGRVIGMVTDTTESQGTSSAPKAEVIVSYVNGLYPGLLDSHPVGTQNLTTNPIIKDADAQQGGNIASNNDLCRSIDQLLDASKNNFVSIQGARMNRAQFYSTIKLPGVTLGYIIPPNTARYRVLTDENKDNVESLFHTFIPRVRSCLPKWEEKDDSDSTYRYHKFRKATGGVVVEVFYNPAPQRGNYYLLLDIAIPTSQRSEW